jgi:regulatory protein
VRRARARRHRPAHLGRGEALWNRWVPDTPVENRVQLPGLALYAVGTQMETCMPVITGLIPSARKPGRFDLLVDGRHEATLSIETVERLALALGHAYDDVRDAVQREASFLATYDRALNMLALRARSSRELRRQLIRKGEPESQVDAAITRLEVAGFLDDGAFARQFARSKALGGGMSRRRIQQELARRGVARQVGDHAIDDVFEEEQLDEGAVVEQAARKKLRSLKSLDAETRKRRLYAFLARRGYDLDDIRRAMQAIGGAEVDAAE